MFFRKIHQYFSFNRLLLLLLGLSITIQVIVITYNHLTGYHTLHDPVHFALRLFRGTILSLIAAFLIAYPDLYMIRHLNRIKPWGKSIFKRIVLELFFAVSIAVFISVIITLFANWLSPYTEDFKGVLINNAMIYAVVNIIIMAILEGWIFYNESSRAREKAETLQEELSQIRFEVLRSQINPHFMFNSLNVLSGLINKDAKKAQEFIDEFSHVYRYVLETIEKPVVSLNQELDFTRSYLFLQQIRYGHNLSYDVKIPARLLNYFMPPLSLQVVLENTTKHNIVNESKPLHIDILSEDTCLIVRNKIQPKVSMTPTTGLGLKNLVKRYGLISSIEPEFLVDGSYYVAKLPLIKAEEDESSDY